MTRKNLIFGSVCVGLAVCISTPAAAGWGSSFGSGGSFGSYGGASYGSAGSHGSHGGRVFGGLFGHRSYASHGSDGGSYGSAGVSVVSYASAGGSTGSYASTGGSSGGSSGLFHGGLISKLRSHHHRKMAWLRSWGSRGGSSGGSWGGSSGGSSGGHVSHGSSGGSWGGSYYGGATHAAMPMDDGEGPPPEPMEEDVPDTPEPPTEDGDLAEPPAPTSASIGNARLLVAVPADAKLYVNNTATKSEGLVRQFVSKGLKRGYKYPYTVKAVMNVNGRDIAQTKRVELTSGTSTEISFDFTSVPTELTIEVPANAELELSGVTTQTTGTTRTFVTRNLAAGQVWSDYKVVVRLEQDGRTLSKEQSIDLRGGESRTISFDFDEAQVASR